MKNPYTKQALAEDVKREVLAELNQGRFQEQDLVENIKREVLMEIGQYRRKQTVANRSLVETIKMEVLADIQGKQQMPYPYGRSYYPDRNQIDFIKKTSY